MDKELNNDDDIMTLNEDSEDEGSSISGLGLIIVLIFIIIGGTAGHFLARFVKYSDEPIPGLSSLYDSLGSTVFFTACYFIGMAVFGGLAYYIVIKFMSKEEEK